MRYWTCLLATPLLATLLPLTAAAERIDSERIDPGTSQVGFELATRWRWFEALQGRFPAFEGEVTTLADGRRQVRLRLDARAAEIVGHPRYTALARSPRFFDAARHPQIEFVSEPYSPALLRNGGDLGGQLRMRGVDRREVFRLAPAGCAAPVRDCAVVVTGWIDRRDYGMDAWQLGLRDEVQFSLQVRLRAEATP